MATTLTQRMNNLDKANRVRVGRGKLRAAVAAGAVPLDVALASPVTANAWVLDVLCWPPRIGRQHALRALNHNQISPARPCGRLTDRQRALLVAELER